MRRFFSFLAVIMLLYALLLPFSLAEEGEKTPKLRALLVSSDVFVSQPETTPAARTNLSLINSVLTADRRGYQTIRMESDTIAEVSALRRAVNETFGDATENDISVFYISTHGLYNVSQSSLSAALLLSDGETEEQLSALMLENIFSGIKGTKVLILDACNAGAFIGKGLSDPAGRVPFQGPEYKVLCSAGGSEESWYFKSKDGNVRRGASYFASIFSNAFLASEGYPGDLNADGMITLEEVYSYVLDNYAASTPQVYPQEDGAFPLFLYDPQAPAASSVGAVTGITFEDTVLMGTLSEVEFSFDVNRESKLVYQIVYFGRGSWQFSKSQYIKDDAEGETVLPGHKTRVLTLALGDEELDTSGYAMVQIFSRDEDNKLFLEGSKLLSVQPTEGDMVLEVRARGTFIPSSGQEMAVRVLHDVPCSLTVSIQNMQGDTVHYLQYDIPTRPQHLVPEGSSFYWDGKLADGSFAPPGSYIVRARTYVAGRVYVAYSEPIILAEGRSAPPAEG